MKTKKIPLRSCVVTKEKLPKQELLRVVKTKEGTILVDLTGKQNGHGAYIKKDIATIEMARSKKLLNRHLECDVPDGIYQELIDIINNK